MILLFHFVVPRLGLISTVRRVGYLRQIQRRVFSVKTCSHEGVIKGAYITALRFGDEIEARRRVPTVGAESHAHNVVSAKVFLTPRTIPTPHPLFIGLDESKDGRLRVHGYDPDSGSRNGTKQRPSMLEDAPGLVET